MSEISAVSITDLDEEVAPPCLERLQREALNCLGAFPGKVVELNNIIDNYAPPTIGAKSRASTAARRIPRSRSTNRDCDLTTNHDHDVTSCYYSMATYDRSRVRHHGVRKRRHCRLRCINRRTLRRRPGPLGQILVFIANSLAVCTKAMVIKPSRFIIDNLITLFLQSDLNRGGRLRDVRCRPSADWGGCSLSTFATAFKDEETTVGCFINIMRPATVQLIADTTILKRWLQALALTSPSPPSSELTQATRSTETIDRWAYELFFHLKYLQTAAVGLKINDDVAHTNLWHRMVQLRDNYVILYETLFDDNQFHKKEPLE